MKGLHKNTVVRLAQDPQQEGQKRSSIIEDSAGHVLKEDKAVLIRWTEYCKDLYSFPMETTKHPLRRPLVNKDLTHLRVLREEVQSANES